MKWLFVTILLVLLVLAASSAIVMVLPGALILLGLYLFIRWLDKA